MKNQKDLRGQRQDDLSHPRQLQRAAVVGQLRHKPRIRRQDGKGNVRRQRGGHIHVPRRGQLHHQRLLRLRRRRPALRANADALPQGVPRLLPGLPAAVHTPQPGRGYRRRRRARHTAAKALRRVCTRGAQAHAIRGKDAIPPTCRHCSTGSPPTTTP